MPEYSFRRARRDDFPMLRAWLLQPHVAPVWGDADTELALIEEEIDGGDCQMYIVLDGDEPFAFIQDWCPHLAGVPHFTDAAPGTRAIDTLLGDPARLGQGHAKAYVNAYARALRRGGAPAVVSDPRLTNPRGIAMYRGAGFADGPQRIAEDGQEVICMEFRG